jgi:hypothetical protein
MKYDVFISYSRKDEIIVHPIVEKLKQGGLSVWIDRSGIESGDAFKRNIVSAIQQSSIVLFFSSIHSNKSEWTAKEIGVAVYEKKIIIPVMLDNSKYNPEILFDLINLDYIQANTLSVDAISETLIHTLNNKLPSKRLPTTPQPDLSAKQEKNTIYADIIKNVALWPTFSKWTIILFCSVCLIAILVFTCLKLLSTGNWNFFILDLLAISGLFFAFKICRMQRCAYWCLISSWILITTALQLVNFKYWQSVTSICCVILAVITVALFVKKNGISVWHEMSLRHAKTTKFVTFCLCALVCAQTFVLYPLMANDFGYKSHRIERGANLLKAKLDGSYANYSIGNDLFISSQSGMRNLTLAKKYYIKGIQNSASPKPYLYINLLHLCKETGDKSTEQFVLNDAYIRLSKDDYNTLINELKTVHNE